MPLSFTQRKILLVKLGSGEKGEKAVIIYMDSRDYNA